MTINQQNRKQHKRLKKIIAQEDINFKGRGIAGDIAKKTFQLLANSYRSKYCDGKARPLYKGELHLPCHNFTGPFTRIDIPAVRNQAPYNMIDFQAKIHDTAYYNASFLNDNKSIKQAIKKADDEFLQNIEPFKNESGYRLGKLGIEGKMAISKVFPSLMAALLSDKHI